MRDIKKAVPVLQHQDGQAGAETYRVPTTSTTEHTTAGPPGQVVHIADFLSRGAQNAVPLRHLVQLTGLPGRDLRRQIEAARRAGKPIVSNDHGYFLAENPQEIARFVKSMRRRARQIQEVAAAVEGAGTDWI